MEQVFISYARKDNETDSEFNINGPIFKYVKFIKRLYNQTVGIDLNVSIDDNFNIGDQLDSRIREEIEKSSVMIAFLSPSYFMSIYCYEEWKAFVEKEGKKIIPFIIQSIDNEAFINRLDKERLDWLNYYKNLNYYELPNISYLEQDEGALIKFRQICTNVSNLLLKEEGKSKSISNTHTIKTPINNEDSADIEENFLEIKKEIASIRNAFLDTDPVCVIYTGGTVGMIRDKNEVDDENSDLVIARNAKDIVDKLPRLRELNFDIHFFSYKKPIDSSNIGVEDWKKLAKIIDKLYKSYDGFVILHGANTLAYTASALSFIFDHLTKPIIITGSELPLVELGTDAEQNIIRAVQAAAPNAKHGPITIPEVCVLYGNSLLRGNRTTRKHSLHTTEGFYSPNYENLGVYENAKLNINHRAVRKTIIQKEKDLITNPRFDINSVYIMDIYPGMDINWYKQLFHENNIKGLILKSYTTGNAPDTIEFIDLIDSLIKKGVIVVNITQCPIGQVELRLFETNAHLFDNGVVNGGDMTVEAAYCKLKYLFGKYENHIKNEQAIKEEFQENLKGELSLSSYSVFFTMNELDTTDKIIYNSKAKLMHGNFDYTDIDHAFIRLQDIILTEHSQAIPEFRIYCNRNIAGLEENQRDSKYRIAMFQKNVHSGEKFSKNLEVTHQLQKIYERGQRLKIQIVSSNKIQFTITSIKLIVYTKNF